MGFDLGLAAAGYQGVKAEQRRMRDDDFTAAQQAYQQSVMDENQSRRGVRDNQAALQDAQATAAQKLLPQQTTVAAGALDAQAADQAFAAQRRPGLQTATLNNDQANLIGSGDNITKAQTIHDWTDYQHDSNAQRIDEAIAGDQSKADQMRGDIYAHVYDLGARGQANSDDLAARFNSAARSKSLFPDLAGKTVASVYRVGDEVQLRDDAGNVVKKIPVAQMKAAYTARNKPEIATLNHGGMLYSRDPLTGKVAPLLSNTIDLSGGGGGGGRGGGSSSTERIISRIQQDYKDKTGNDMSYVDALQQYHLLPQRTAAGLAKADLSLSMETDPTKRAAGLSQHVTEATNMFAPGLDNTAPTKAVSAAVLDAIGRR